MSQIRLNKTPGIEEVLTFFQKYHLLSEAEIIKVALAEKYDKEKNLEKKHTEGKKLGDRLLKKKGLKRKDVTE